MIMKWYDLMFIAGIAMQIIAFMLKRADVLK